jgi:hypothetical protein
MIRTKHLRVCVPVALALVAGTQPADAQSTPAPATSAAQPTKPEQDPPAAGAIDDTRETNLRAYTELIRSDLRTQHVAIITAVMEFTEEEDVKFWPVYREYEADLARINDDRIALIKNYASHYETLTDAVADTLAYGAFDLEAQRHALKLKYYDRLKQVISPRAAARFFQVENQILLLLDLQIASALPIAPK